MSNSNLKENHLGKHENLNENVSKEEENSSESESEEDKNCLNSKRLGNCEVCGAKPAVYTCPKCEVKTCCLTCVKIHKRELECDGIRDRTKFIPIKEMTEKDFRSDYYFLEECTRYVEDRKHDPLKRLTFQNRNLPRNLSQLRKACQERGIRVNFLMPHFTRRKQNTSYINLKQRKIFWHIEWIFLNASNIKYIDKKCDEDKPLKDLLDKYFNIDSLEPVPKKRLLTFYQSFDIFDVKILLKAEGVKKSRSRFYLLDPKKSLKDNLKGKTIVEFPSIYITYNESLDGFEIIDSDDDVEAETESYQKSLEELHKELLEKERQKLKSLAENEENEDSDSEKIEKRVTKKKKEERKRKLEQFETKPNNYLFSDPNLIDTLTSSSEDEHEDDKNTTKKIKV